MSTRRVIVNRMLFPVLIGLLLAGAGVSFYISNSPSPALPAAAASAPLHVYLLDVAGWYEITANETAVASEFDLTLGSLKELPSRVGPWKGVPYDYGAAVEDWFEEPDLGLSALYTAASGHQLWFSTFGSAGRKSYVLFEHTPVTSYPAAGWALLDSRPVEISTAGGSLKVQRALLQKESQQRVVYYWYVWVDSARDPARGVITMRVHIPVVSSFDEAERDGETFLRALFPQVLPWRRF